METLINGKPNYYLGRNVVHSVTEFNTDPNIPPLEKVYVHNQSKSAMTEAYKAIKKGNRITFVTPQAELPEMEIISHPKVEETVYMGLPVICFTFNAEHK